MSESGAYANGKYPTKIVQKSKLQIGGARACYDVATKSLYSAYLGGELSKHELHNGALVEKNHQEWEIDDKTWDLAMAGDKLYVSTCSDGTHKIFETDKEMLMPIRPLDTSMIESEGSRCNLTSDRERLLLHVSNSSTKVHVFKSGEHECELEVPQIPDCVTKMKLEGDMLFIGNYLDNTVLGYKWTSDPPSIEGPVWEAKEAFQGEFLVTPSSGLLITRKVPDIVGPTESDDEETGGKKDLYRAILFDTKSDEKQPEAIEIKNNECYWLTSACTDQFFVTEKGLYALE